MKRAVILAVIYCGEWRIVKWFPRTYQVLWAKKRIISCQTGQTPLLHKSTWLWHRENEFFNIWKLDCRASSMTHSSIISLNFLYYRREDPLSVKDHWIQGLKNNSNHSRFPKGHIKGFEGKRNRKCYYHSAF